MAERRFPRERDDGTVSVAAQFTLLDEGGAEDAERAVADWNGAHGADALADLTEEPLFELRDERRFTVSVTARPGSRNWKDWLVWVTRSVEQAGAGRFDGFIDLVTGKKHRGSLG